MRRGGKRADQDLAGFAGQVERAGDEHDALLAGQRDRTLDGIGDVGDRLDLDVEGPRRSGELGGGHGAGRVDLGRDDEVGPGGTERLEHLGRITVLEQGDDQHSTPAEVELVVEGHRRGSRARWVVGPVDDHDRGTAHQLEPTGHQDRPVGGLDHVVGQLTAEERFGRHEGEHGVVGLVTAVEREEHVLVGTGRREQVEHLAADGGPDVAHLEVDAHHGRTERRPRLEDLDQIRILLADHDVGARFDDARLLAGHVAAPVPRQVGVVLADVGDDRDVAVDHVGRVEQAEQAHLDDGHIDGDLGEPGERRRGEQLEVGRLHPRERTERGDLADDLAEGVVADRFEVPLEAFVDALEMRARVGADGEARLDEQRRGEPGNRTLAVRARDVHRAERPLGVAEHVEQLAHRVERQPFDAAGPGLEVDVAIEERERVAVLH